MIDRGPLTPTPGSADWGSDMRTDDLAPRLDRLERENFRLRVGVMVVVLAAAALMVMGQAAPSGTASKVRATANEVRARAFVLEDANGNVRGRLGVFASGSPSLSLRDHHGNVRLLVGVSDEGLPMIGWTDGMNGIPLIISITSDGPVVTMKDKNGKSRVRLNVGADGPRLELLDSNEGTRTVVGQFSLQEARTGVVEQRSESSLLLFDKDGKVILRAP
jgi:hypothetical protein